MNQSKTRDRKQSNGICIIAECENEASNEIKNVEQENEVEGLFFFGGEIEQENEFKAKQEIEQSNGLCVIAVCENEASNEIKNVEQ